MNSAISSDHVKPTNTSGQSVATWVKVAKWMTEKSHCCRPMAVSQTPAKQNNGDASAVLIKWLPGEPAQTSCIAQPLNMPHPQLLGWAKITAKGLCHKPSVHYHGHQHAYFE